MTSFLFKYIKRILFFIIAYACSIHLQAQHFIDISIHWNNLQKITLEDTIISETLSFQTAQYLGDKNFIPFYVHQEPWSINRKVKSIKFSLSNFIDATPYEINILKKQSILSKIEVSHDIRISNKEAYLLVKFIPIIKDVESGIYKKLISGKIEIIYENENFNKRKQQRVYKSHSILSSGDFYKISVDKEGIYKLSYSDLKSLGVNPESINPKNIRIYGIQGGMLPQSNSEFRYDDLIENPIEVIGEEDGTFDSNDYVIFYGSKSNNLKYNQLTNKFDYSKNLYDDKTYYFLTISTSNGKRVSLKPSILAVPTHIIDTYNSIMFHEKDEVNLIKSGRNWYGEDFNNQMDRSILFDIPNIDLSKPIFFIAEVIARSSKPSQFTFRYNNSVITNALPQTIDPTIYYLDYASPSKAEGEFIANTNKITIDINYNKPISTSMAWLDKIILNYTGKLDLNQSQLLFNNTKAVGLGNVAEFKLSNINSTISIWNITDISNMYKIQSSIIGANGVFKEHSDTLNYYIAFSDFLTPTLLGKIPNQNLHGLPQVDFIIVSHPDFITQAERLGDFHKEKDNLTYVVVTPQQIYNEFSSGAQDVTAVRDFVKMFYDRAGNDKKLLPKYLLLFGDASYDPKNRLKNNTNYVISYHSENSYSPTASYVSDDYFGLLDDNEGVWNAFDNDAVDIGIGRLPVKTLSEATVVVNKIMNYSSSKGFGSWRNNLCFVADDGDNNLHMQHANSLATKVETAYPSFNIDKIYFDSYPQENTSSGQRYPDVQKAINLRVQNGTLMMNYTGHGGEVGWAKERVLEISDISSWTNYNMLPLFVTATCEFSRYDDPDRQAAGEYVLLNQNGGGIALLSTVRLVFAGQNFYLNSSIYDYAFKPLENGEMPRLGDIYRLAKRDNINLNSRNFTLLGDPALRLAYPQNSVTVSSINGKNISSVADTIRPLSKVTIKGMVLNSLGLVDTNYIGYLYPIVYDKPQENKTISNDGDPTFVYELQKNLLYSGKVSVNKGKYEFSFVVPKDISFKKGFGKLSLYSNDLQNDASGSYENFVVGGELDTTNKDNLGPSLEVYLNDKKFVSGGLTNENPKLLVYLADSSGINTLGSSIGHDITLVLDDKTSNKTILNNYYQASLDTYKEGVVNYPLSKLAVGKHNLRVKAWDVFNNSSEEFIEFIVENSAELALEHVLNYPNPFTTSTNFFFEHNKPFVNLNVKIEILTVSGAIIKTIFHTINTNGFRSDGIVWDGNDDFGDLIGRGVYIYRLSVSSEDGKQKAEQFQKLVILK